MARLGYLFATIFVAILAISTQQASALKCYSCNNFEKFCDDPMDASKLTEADKLKSIIDCTNGRCIKSIKKIPVAGKEPTISLNRICVRSPQLAEQECKGDFEFCQSCDTDLCNSAPQYGPVAALVVAIPMAIAKIFLF